MPLAPRWYTGLPDSRGRHDLAWLRRTGEPLTPEDWNNRMSRVLGAWIGAPGRSREPLLLMFNGRDTDAGFHLPPGRWVAVLDTSAPDGRSTWRGGKGPGDAPLTFHLPKRSVVLLRDTQSR
jgi:glycogen operon protein